LFCDRSLQGQAAPDARAGASELLATVSSICLYRSFKDGTQGQYSRLPMLSSVFGLILSLDYKKEANEQQQWLKGKRRGLMAS
jgi:hypothetical protein